MSIIFVPSCDLSIKDFAYCLVGFDTGSCYASLLLPWLPEHLKLHEPLYMAHGKARFKQKTWDSNWGLVRVRDMLLRCKSRDKHFSIYDKIQVENSSLPARWPPRLMAKHTTEHLPLETYMAEGELQVSATVKCYRQTITLHITSYEKDQNSKLYWVPTIFLP